MAINTVEEYFGKHETWKEELEELREMLLSTGLDESIKWGAPTYSLKGKNVVGIGAFKKHYGLWLFQGALLKKNTALLHNAQDEKTSAMRQIRYEKGDDLKLEVLREYVLEAIQNHREGKELKADRSQKTLELPPELVESFEKDAALKESFQKLSPGKQREYATHVSEAKREATRQNRLEKILPMIRDGKGLYDKYKNC